MRMLRICALAQRVCMGMRRQNRGGYHRRRPNCSAYDSSRTPFFGRVSDDADATAGADIYNGTDTRD